MKKKEKKKQRPTPKSDLKKVIILVIAIIIIIPVGIVTFFQDAFIIPTLYVMQMVGEANNPAKDLAKIMHPFAEEHNLKLIKEYNNAAGLDNPIDSYEYVYHGTQTSQEMYDLIRHYLEEQGYNLTSNAKTDPDCEINNCQTAYNEGHAYWEITGKNINGDTVEVTIADHEGEASAKTLLMTDFTFH